MAEKITIDNVDGIVQTLWRPVHEAYRFCEAAILPQARGEDETLFYGVGDPDALLADGSLVFDRWRAIRGKHAYVVIRDQMAEVREAVLTALDRIEDKEELPRRIASLLSVAERIPATYLASKAGICRMTLPGHDEAAAERAATERLIGDYETLHARTELICRDLCLLALR